MRKERFLAEVLRRSGILEYSWQRIKSGLYVFNYHRVGDKTKTLFDPNVFSCNSDQFEVQIRTIKERFKVVSISDLIELKMRKERPDCPLALITFDDGYADNFHTAAKILSSFSLPATFFLPTDYIETGLIPWWDKVAWMINKAGSERVLLPDGQTLSIASHDRSDAIQKTLRYIKVDKIRSMDQKLSNLSKQLEVDPTELSSTDLFMSWRQSRKLITMGMDIGSHTASHQILSHLSSKEQHSELTKAKRVLEENLNKPINSLAYPVGGKSAYNRESKRIAKEVGYELAFNFRYGFNATVHNDSYDIFRIPVEDQDPSVLKAQIIRAPELNRIS